MSRAEPDEQLAVSRADYAIIGGGTPTAEQLAAVVVALTPVVAEQTDGLARTDVAAWSLAALHEGVGGGPLTAHADVISLGGR